MSSKVVVRLLRFFCTNKCWVLVFCSEHYRASCEELKFSVARWLWRQWAHLVKVALWSFCCDLWVVTCAKDCIIVSHSFRIVFAPKLCITIRPSKTHDWNLVAQYVAVMRSGCYSTLCPAELHRSRLLIEYDTLTINRPMCKYTSYQDFPSS